MRAGEGPPQLEAAGIRKGGANAESPPRVPDRRIEFLWMVCYRPQPFRGRFSAFAAAQQSRDARLNKSIPRLRAHAPARESAIGRGASTPSRVVADDNKMAAPWHLQMLGHYDVLIVVTAFLLCGISQARRPSLGGEGARPFRSAGWISFHPQRPRSRLTVIPLGKRRPVA